LQAVEKLVGHSQHDQAGLTGDRQANLVVDRHPTAALEPFLGDKHRHPVSQPFPLAIAEPLHLPHVAGKDVTPDGRPRLFPDRATASRPQPAKHDTTRSGRRQNPESVLRLQGKPSGKQIQCKDQAAC